MECAKVGTMDCRMVDRKGPRLDIQMAAMMEAVLEWKMDLEWVELTALTAVVR